MNKTIYLILITTLTLFSRQNLFIIKSRDGEVLSSKSIEHRRNIYFDSIIEDREVISVEEDSSDINFFKNRVISEAKRFLGGRYLWGGTTPSGFDCSGYVKYVYAKAGINLPRTAYEQSMVGMPVDRDMLKKGDLLFFLTDKKRHLPITHVGLYIGDGRFIHAASRKDGIIISNLSKSKYDRVFVKAKRLLY
ncbi:MAG: C40 family peptidase [Epsilonproteobacteria bacterium]|nr:C40 family peptidase [Campylobacterota bacterium]